MPLTDAKEGIHHTHAKINLIAYPLARMSLWRSILNQIKARPFTERSLTIVRFAKGVDHASELGNIRINNRIISINFNGTAEANSFKRAKRHHQSAIFSKANNFT